MDTIARAVAIEIRATLVGTCRLTTAVVRVIITFRLLTIMARCRVRTEVYYTDSRVKVVARVEATTCRLGPGLRQGYGSHLR